jgi:hypothetical protein
MNGGDMADNNEKILELLQDMIKINAVIATELIQLVENSSRQLRGDIPESCRIQHGELRSEVIEIAEKWNENCGMLRKHNIDH